jgi:DNA processing protein
VIEVLGLPQSATAPAAAPALAPTLVAPRSLADTSNLHSQILARLGPSPLAEDQLSRDLQQPPSVLASALISLELDGQVQRLSGGLLARVV